MAKNKTDYTYMARFTKAKVVNFFQNKGAKVHFNWIKYEDPELSKQTGDKEIIVRDIFYDQFMLIKDLRYGVI